MQSYIGCSGWSCSSWDGNINEKDFGKIQKDRQKKMEVWAKEVKKVQKEISLAIVAANNHYDGFGLATANQFRVMPGVEPVVWEEMKQATFYHY